MGKQPLVSVIVPTYNSSEFIEACLQSIKDQTYKNIELIVVDNNSKDNTKEIAKKFTEQVFNKGPERSAQRNYGVEKSKGEYLIIIDSDMELSNEVVIQCVELFQFNTEIAEIIIPEESFGKGFWAQCKKLERSFYIDLPWMEAARAFTRSAYVSAGGYNEDLTSGEDWDLSNRVGEGDKVGRVSAIIKHNEGTAKLIKTLQKKYYYATRMRKYLNHNPERSILFSKIGPLNRYKLFFSHPIMLFRNPVLGVGMLFMKTLEFMAGAIAYLSSKDRRSNDS